MRSEHKRKMLEKWLDELNEYLKENGLKQKWLADQIGVHVNQLKRWSNGHNEPIPENYEKIKRITQRLRRINLNIAE